MSEQTPAPVRAQQQWLLTVLPAFPLLLLVLRVWYLSRQNLSTMLLVVQHISPLGMTSALLITMVWVVPAVLLVLRMLGALLAVSAATDQSTSLLARITRWMPDWVVALAVGLAVLTWQLRFLPTLLMLTVAIIGLVARQRYPGNRLVRRTTGVALPVGSALVAYAWLAPGIAAAVDAGEHVTALLLLLPPAFAAFLTGPVPSSSARLVTHWAALAGALVAPIVVGAIFLRAPILPIQAVEVDPDPRPDNRPVVLRGHLISVDDRMTTLLDGRGTVHFVPNDQVVSKTLCPEPEQVPTSRVDVRGWHVERTALEWLAPTQDALPTDPRCQGRPAQVP
ncbi:hypothetical protein GA0074692_2248 [Micromonospora pallida]|uniref:Uncharacterized protein n=1 Tax=Micromonospora pallida TaxID=145854 RepID=A0A1C6SC67_9ACTN|nr:hypothetical protein [Micromonospora pallida]SCL26873.1 hypothetical protein GA0074692_2248 [Micromonospora pallida]